MGSLSDRDRARLPDRAFAYIDSNGRRLLPINDQAHVRNALARFGQVDFEDEDTRATLKAVGDALPEGIEAVSLGAYRLRGLDEPMELLQAAAEGLRRDFPPPRSL